MNKNMKCKMCGYKYHCCSSCDTHGEEWLNDGFCCGDCYYEYAQETMESISPDFPKEQILFSPVSEKIPPSRLAEWILEDHLNVRLHLQLHKIIWPDKKRGV